MPRIARRLLAALSIVLVASCAARAPQRTWRGEAIAVPDEARVYMTDPRSQAATEGGAPALEAEVAAALAKRGDKAVADGALTATARWLLREANQQRPVGPQSADAASRHFGFSGVVTSLVSYDAAHPDTWKEALAQIPKNVQLNRFGVCASPTGQSSAVIFGHVALSFEPIARFVEPGATVRLRGEIDQRFATAQVYLTKPDGTVETHQMAARKLDYATVLTTPGKYKLEVMGDGATGPSVISNVPLFVGIAEPPLTEKVSHSSSPREAEATMLRLLNETRVSARLSPVAQDAELREVAMRHSNDMADHDFFSHVSPSTGSPTDRVARAGLVVADYGENLAQSPTPESAHEGLMESPGHRAIMLGAFTHVGIAAVEKDDNLIVTMLFGRRPDPAKLPREAAQVEAAFFALRDARGLSRPTVDPLYRTAAQQGVLAYSKASKPTAEIAAKATSEAIRNEVARLRTARAATTACTLFIELMEVEQLERNPLLVAKGLAKFGVGAQMRTDDKGSRLATVFILEGVPCH
jgi:uncharacterized protein YkwD